MTDPWATDAPVREPSPHRNLRSILVVLIGTGGAFVGSWLHDGAPQVLGSLLVGIVVEAGLRIRPPTARLIAFAVAAAGSILLGGVVFGFASPTVVILSVLVTHVSLAPSGTTSASGPTAALVPPVVIAGQVLWVRTGSPWLCASILLVAFVVLGISLRWREQTAAVERVSATAIRTAANAIASVILFLFALPLLYLPGAVVARFDRRTGWHSHEGDAELDANLPFITPAPAVRRRRHLLAATTVVVIGLATVAVVHAQRAAEVTDGGSRPVVRHDSTETPTAGEGNQLDFLDDVPYSSRPGLKGHPWADQLQADTRTVALVPRSDVGYVTADTSSSLVNVHDGVRRTVTGSCSGCPHLEIWLAGGSTVFGIGQRDDRTIASDMVRSAADQGIDLRVVNLGTVGWTIHQEANDVIERLDRAVDPPDGVVFVDGFNDAMAAAIRSFTGRGEEGAPLVLDPQAGVDVIRHGDNGDPDAVDRAATMATVAYRAEQARVRAALDRRGVRSWFFLQPDAFASRRQLNSIRAVYRRVPGIIDRPELPKVLQLTVDGLTGSAIDLRHVFDKSPPVFIDVVHTGEDGARIVAAHVEETIRSWMRETAR